ncbi:hypothetical protein Nepgr_015292 [Nepenthes gracilis]|uniref:Thymidylate synthase n=1 Tax=Nepenthes gracilis TaxID=150966 RepID=A0AAD3SND4_NEPGR|nr:hypothetical protein Nepgr_015292 [Nepenthes gracilis]
MGRRAWDSIPLKHRPLLSRLNVILTHSGSIDLRAAENVLTCRCKAYALELLATSPYCLSIEKVFVIGGGQILREALNAPSCDAVHITKIEKNVECDNFYPCCRYFAFSALMILERYEEYMYLRLVQDNLSTGNVKNDRIGTGTLSKFCCQMRFNLPKTFPLLTTKVRVIEELLWFISGSTNAKVIHIWDRYASRNFLDCISLADREEGDLGPVYGFHWRHLCARYTDTDADYNGQGIDQLSDVIHKIKNNPDDRRIILSAWNPYELKSMALPPCHMFAQDSILTLQFYTANGELSCQMYQHSTDMGLGMPFNAASYALLTCMIAHVCDLVPGDFIHVIGDAHVYRTHVGPLQEQLQNQPKPFPVSIPISDMTHTRKLKWKWQSRDCSVMIIKSPSSLLPVVLSFCDTQDSAGLSGELPVFASRSSISLVDDAKAIRCSKLPLVQNNCNQDFWRPVFFHH